MQCLSNSEFDGEQLCVNTCTSSLDCPDELTACGDVGGADLCAYDSCSNYYGPCNNASTDDGTCFPFLEGTTLVGLCEAGGSQATGTLSCATYRSVSAGSSDICVTGDVCVDVEGASICEPVCGTEETTADGGPGCAAANSCVALGGLFGACLESCVQGVTVCPSGTSCLQTGQGDVCAP